jgi:hypothetical protein
MYANAQLRTPYTGHSGRTLHHIQDILRIRHTLRLVVVAAMVVSWVVVATRQARAFHSFCVIGHRDSLQQTTFRRWYALYNSFRPRGLHHLQTGANAH